MCGFCELLAIPMHGKLLEFFGKMYMLCPACTCVMQITAEQYIGKSILCTTCSLSKTSPEQDTCFHCYNNSEDMQSVALSTNAIHVCSACWRQWMHSNDITAHLDEETAHRAINEQWSTNRVAVYCACI